jgi:hypothetical protein
LAFQPSGQVLAKYSELRCGLGSTSSATISHTLSRGLDPEDIAELQYFDGLPDERPGHVCRLLP